MQSCSDTDIDLQPFSHCLEIRRNYLLWVTYCFCWPGGYKGFGLAMMVDVFCGMLSGSTFGTNIKRWKGEEERVHNLVTK